MVTTAHEVLGNSLNPWPQPSWNSSLQRTYIFGKNWNFINYIVVRNSDHYHIRQFYCKYNEMSLLIDVADILLDNTYI